MMDEQAKQASGRAVLDYRETLVLFYEEEIAGEAYFARLAECHAGRQRDALTLLAKIETVAAATMAPLLCRHGLVAGAPAALHAAGRAEADGKISTPWPALIDEMSRAFPIFVEEFEQLERLAPPADKGPLEILTAHEVAAIAFLELEAAGDPNSLAPLERYLARHGDRT